MQPNTVLTRNEKVLGRHSKSRKVLMRAESGMCNMCSAPCSSCLHNNRALMGSKTDEFSDETSQGNVGSQYSVNDVRVRINAFDSGQQTASETSNLLSVNSNYDSFSENAESKAGLRTCDSSLIGGNSVASGKVCLKLEMETEMDTSTDVLPTEAVRSSEHIEVHKVKESCGLPDQQESSLQSQPVDDCDESDISEQDVKVCDICGDAGREDLLAICSRCSDGAEHTYCMREMIDKVPEGDWLCEECKFDDDIKNQSSRSDGALDTNHFEQLDKKDFDVEGNETNKDGNETNKDVLNTTTSGKRHAENIEVASAAKMQALEPTVGSPKTSSPRRAAALYRDSAFRNLSKGMKPTRQLSLGTCSINDTPEAALSPTGLRGTLLKSKSFNFTNAKAKVELVNEVVPQKQKSAREPAMKEEGAARLMGKSMSFKSVNPGRLNPSESKVKMLSPNFSHGLDLKGLKQAKERKFLERKNSFKSERSVVSTATGNTSVSLLKGDKKLEANGERYSLPSVSNDREPKGVQADSKLSTLSKFTSHVAHRGETKRQLCLPNVAGSSSTSGISSLVEQKPNQTSFLHDPPSSTYTAERLFCNVDGGLPDGLPRPQDSTNFGERTSNSSVYHSKPSMTTGGRSAPCQKCKEIGHSAQFCPVEGPRTVGVDASAARSSREAMNKDNKLKAAIEAAMLKKPEIYRKNKMLNQSDELSVSSTTCDIRSQDQSSTPINTSKMTSADEVHKGQAAMWNSTADSGNQTTFNKLKQFSPLPSEAATLQTRDISPVVSSDGKPFIRDLTSHASASMSVLLKMSAIPENEYIWRGGIEINRSGKLPELRDGIQAHLSTCASPKVLEVVNKFSSKILLNEVPRLSTWPEQFKEIGAKEENIALYFFAKDLESYEKNYKSLLETMMKSDLALKANFDGVELLILPSNHLPEKSQRWNMLYYLWGVFRGKKLNCLQNASGSSKNFFIPNNISTAIMYSPENTCSVCPINEDLPTCSEACNVPLASERPALTERPALMESSFGTINRVCDNIASSLDLKDQCLQANVEGQGSRLDATSLSRIQRIGELSNQETRCTRTPMEENIGPECKLDVKLQPFVQATRTISASEESEKMEKYPGKIFDIQQIPSHCLEIPDRVNSSKDQVTCERSLMEEKGSFDTKPVLDRDASMRGHTKQLDNQLLNHRKRLREDSTWTVSQACENGVLLDGGCVSKKQKTDFSGLNVCNSSRRDAFLSRDSFVSGMCGIGTSFPMDERGKEAFNEGEILKDIGTSERYLFHVDRRPVKDTSLVGNTVAWKVLSSEDENDDIDRLPDASPNLELALGAEMKSSRQGVLPFLVGKVDLKDGQEELPPEKVATKEEEDISACLSLSLSFPSLPDEERTAKSVSKVEPIPDRKHVSTSLFLFDSLSDK